MRIFFYPFFYKKDKYREKRKNPFDKKKVLLHPNNVYIAIYFLKSYIYVDYISIKKDSLEDIFLKEVRLNG